MHTSQLIKSIRSKYVGTADEHSLLASLEADATAIESETTRRIEDELRTRAELLDVVQERCNWIQSASRIDEAVYNLHQEIKFKYGLDFGLENVAVAMKSRGLTRDLVLQIAAKME